MPEVTDSGVLDQDSFINTLFAINLRLLRADKGISQAELAAAMGISHRTLQRIERAESDPTLTFLIRAARALGADYSNLIIYEGKDQPVDFFNQDQILAMGQGPSLVLAEQELDALLDRIGSAECFEKISKQVWFTDSEMPLMVSNFFDFYVNQAAVSEVFPSFSAGKIYAEGSTHVTRRAAMSVMNQMLGRDRSWSSSQAAHNLEGRLVTIELVSYHRQAKGCFLHLSWVRPVIKGNAN